MKHKDQNKLFFHTGLLVVLIFVTSANGAKAHSIQPGSSNATYLVTKTSDSNDGSCDAGDCSLREAIGAANANPGLDTVSLPSGTYQLTIPGRGEDAAASGDLDILDDLIISGTVSSTTIIDGNAIDRVFHVPAGLVSLTIKGVTIQGGVVPDSDVLGGGGILTAGDLNLEEVTLQHNLANRGAGLRNSFAVSTISHSLIYSNSATSEGGGIFSDGTLNLSDSVVQENHAASGGGIGSSEEVILNQVVISGNVATDDGGGIYNDNIAKLRDVRLSGNRAGFGGGIQNSYYTELDRVTLDHNVAVSDGGGIYSDDTAILTNVTFSQNQAGGRGGALFNTANASLKNDTFYSNQAEGGGGIYNTDSGSISIVNSILAASTNGNCVNFGGVLTSLGYNLEDTNICGLTATGDWVDTPPNLDPNLVVDVFGPPLHKLQTNSRAIDAGSNAQCAVSAGNGVFRPVDGDKDGTATCDIGAHERVTAGFVAMQDSSVTVAENNGNAVLSVVRSGSSSGVSVDFATVAGGTARAEYDYSPAAGTLTWSTGITTPQTFSVPLIDDIYQETDETFLVKLSNPLYGVGVIYPYDQASVTILSNDPGGPPEPLFNVYLPTLKR